MQICLIYVNVFIPLGSARNNLPACEFPPGNTLYGLKNKHLAYQTATWA